MQQKHSYLNLSKKLAKASTGVNFEAFGKLQNELHDDGLMSHLLHQCVFLQEEEAFLQLNI